MTDAVNGETCDDGNTTDGDGCSAACQTAPCHAIQMTSTQASVEVDSTGFALGTSDWTFEFWIRIDDGFAHGTGTNLFCQNESYAAFAIRPRYMYHPDSGDNLGRVNCNYYSNSGGPQNLEAYSAVINDGNWHHVACNYETGQVTVYTDGMAGQTDTGSPNLSATSSMAIGNPIGYGDYQSASVSFGPIRFSRVGRYTNTFIPAMDWAVDANTVAQYLVSTGFDGSTLVDEAGGDNTGTHRQDVIAAGTCD